MRHFHVIRWGSVGLSTGETISVPDVDFASVASVSEAERVATLAEAGGGRTATYECTDRCCTLHAARYLATLAPTA